MKVRLILNGKSAGIPALRQAVYSIREAFPSVEFQVRVTWEGGDAERYALEAGEQNLDRVIAGGGDGSIHEVLCGLMKVDDERRPALGILPLGTANDFATSAQIPMDYRQALELAITGSPVTSDVGQAGDWYFMNLATGGFGAEVTTATPPQIKAILGGSAYSLMGLVMSLNFQPVKGKITLPDQVINSEVVVGAMGNGRQAGGGKVLAPDAYINDGLLDLLLIKTFPLSEAGVVLEELGNLHGDNKYVSYHQVPWAEIENDSPAAINLDGEPHRFEKVRINVVPGAVNVVLPEYCPLVKS